jgi:hypothetical protein
MNPNLPLPFLFLNIRFSLIISKDPNIASTQPYNFSNTSLFLNP